MAYNVSIKDTKTDEVRVFRYEYGWDEYSEFLWSEGNYACDCNRGTFYADAVGEEDPDRDCGDARYAITGITDDAGNLLYENEEEIT